MGVPVTQKMKHLACFQLLNSSRDKDTWWLIDGSTGDSHWSPKPSISPTSRLLFSFELSLISAINFRQLLCKARPRRDFSRSMAAMISTTYFSLHGYLSFANAFFTPFLGWILASIVRKATSIRRVGGLEGFDYLWLRFSFLRIIGPVTKSLDYGLSWLDPFSSSLQRLRLRIWPRWRTVGWQRWCSRPSWVDPSRR